MTMLATQPRKSTRIAATLTLTIGDVAYSVERIAPAGWRLSKLAGNGNVYDIEAGPDGPTCDCGDFTFRRDGLDAGGCKHLKAMTKVGLIDAPKAQPASDAGSKAEVSDSDTTKAPGTPATPRPASRPFGEGVRQTDAPGEAEKAEGAAVLTAAAATIKATMKAEAEAARVARDRAASRAFGIRVPAKAATPAPAAALTPREIGDRIVTMLACPDCQGEGCAECVDAPAVETPAPAACCPASEPAPCGACVDQAPAEPAVERDREIVPEPSPAYACGCVAPSAIDPAILGHGCPACLAEMAEVIDGPPEPPSGPRDDAGGDDGRLDLGAWIDAQSEFYGLLNTMAGDLVARHLANLAQMVRAVQSFPGECLTPMEAEGRIEALSGVA